MTATVDLRDLNCCNLRTPVGYLIAMTAHISHPHGGGLLASSAGRNWKTRSVKLPAQRGRNPTYFLGRLFGRLPPLAVPAMLRTEREREREIGPEGKIATSRHETPVGHQCGLKHGGFPL